MVFAHFLRPIYHRAVIFRMPVGQRGDMNPIDIEFTRKIVNVTTFVKKEIVSANYMGIHLSQSFCIS